MSEWERAWMAAMEMPSIIERELRNSTSRPLSELEPALRMRSKSTRSISMSSVCSVVIAVTV